MCSHFLPPTSNSTGPSPVYSRPETVSLDPVVKDSLTEISLSRVSPILTIYQVLPNSIYSLIYSFESFLPGEFSWIIHFSICSFPLLWFLILWDSYYMYIRSFLFFCLSSVFVIFCQILFISLFIFLFLKTPLFSSSISLKALYVAFTLGFLLI